MFEITPKAEEMMVAFFKERNEKLSSGYSSTKVAEPGPPWAWLWMSHRKATRFSTRTG